MHLAAAKDAQKGSESDATAAHRSALRRKNWQRAEQVASRAAARRSAAASAVAGKLPGGSEEQEGGGPQEVRATPDSAVSIPENEAEDDWSWPAAANARGVAPVRPGSGEAGAFDAGDPAAGVNQGVTVPLEDPPGGTGDPSAWSAESSSDGSGGSFDDVGGTGMRAGTSGGRLVPKLALPRRSTMSLRRSARELSAKRSPGSAGQAGGWSSRAGERGGGTARGDPPAADPWEPSGGYSFRREPG